MPNIEALLTIDCGFGVSKTITKIIIMPMLI